MKIGELAARTNVSARLLRYYEEQGLITPDRAGNGYRDYAEGQVDRVVQIRGLLDAGLPTKIIREIIPCLDNPCTIHIRDATPELVATLEHERDQIDQRIRCLTRNRDAITSYIKAVRGAGRRRDGAASGLPSGHAVSGPRARRNGEPPTARG
jgi:DNA-binding transcriptional MerR regulator